MARAQSMPVIKPTCVRDLKLRVNLADVVSRVVSLRKAGGTRLKGLCPFHNEKTPSFNVDADKGFYKCFGCGKAGDAITFVRETEQLSFTEAVEALGQRYGVAIEYEAGLGAEPRGAVAAPGALRPARPGGRPFPRVVQGGRARGRLHEGVLGRRAPVLARARRGVQA